MDPILQGLIAGGIVFVVLIVIVGAVKASLQDAEIKRLTLKQLREQEKISGKKEEKS
jgi:hypothetical protein